MLKTRVIADNVLNLTDARYFAAFGVDYLIFNLSSIDEDAIAEICEWVEGVQVLLGIEENLTPSMLDFILKVKPAGFVSQSDNILATIKAQFPDSDCFLRAQVDVSHSDFHLLLSDSDLNSVSNRNPERKVFVKTNNVDVALSSDAIDGIIVEGEQEEKIGFKNFDQLDELFDKLLVEY